MSSDKSDSLKAEWKLLIHGFLGEADTSLDKEVSLQEVRKDLGSIKKALSLKRKKANQQIEKIKTKIEQHMTILETLKLVGSDFQETEALIEELRNEGAAASEVLGQLDQQLLRVRELEQE